MDEGHSDFRRQRWYGMGGFGVALGCLHGLPAWLRTHLTCWQRSRYRRAMNGLVSAQVTSRR